MPVGLSSTICDPNLTERPNKGSPSRTACTSHCNERTVLWLATRAAVSVSKKAGRLTLRCTRSAAGFARRARLNSNVRCHR